jgi:transaldolase
MNSKKYSFFFDTADEQYIRSTWEFLKANGGFSGTDVVGVTSNPNAMNKIGCNDVEAFDRVVPQLCRLITEIRGGQPGGVVFVQFPQMSMDKESMWKFVEHILPLTDGVTKVGLKIPPYTHVLEMVPELNKWVQTNVTGVSDCATALKCASYGVKYVSILNGRMAEIGVDDRQQVKYIRQGNLGNTEIITASMRTLDGLAGVIAEQTVPTIGSRVFDLMIAKGPEGATEFRRMWDQIPSEFAPAVTPEMTKLSLSFFEQMDNLGAPMLNSFKEKGIL